MPLEDFIISPLTPDFDVSTFDCGNSDINEFLKEDALNYQNHHLANTFVFYLDPTTIVAFFCISNDCLIPDSALEFLYQHKTPAK